MDLLPENIFIKKKKKKIYITYKFNTKNRISDSTV